MYRFSTLLATLLILMFILVSCGSEGDRSVRDEARQSLRDLPPGSVQPPAANINQGAAVATGGVQHYICANNCEGSGGPSAGTCPVCGSEYQHNQAYHNQPPTGNAINPVNPTIPTTPATPEPAQNAAGVYHYTCPDGCSGGAGSATACASCGKTLVHNTAYHSN